MANFVCIFFCFLHYFILFHDTGAMPESSAETIRGSKSSVHIGAIFDPDSTLDGVIAEISMNLAISDFYALRPNYQTRLHLRVTTAKDLVDTAGAAVDLLENFQVDAIIGPQISTAAPFLVELGEKFQSPYFIRIAQNDSVQVKAISAVLKKFNWYEVVLVYEDTEYGTGFISYLVDALQETNIRVAHMSAIPKSAEDFQISKALMKLMTMQTRVFIVYMNTALASRLFALADQNGMMSKGYAWIITAGLSNSLRVRLAHCISKELESFNRRWKRELHLMKPKSPLTGINFSGLWAYDTICALARAAEKILLPTNPSFVKPNTSESRIDFASLGASRIGSRLRDELRNTRFKGLSGEFNLINRKLESSVFEIINVIGNGRVVGYWTPEKGISQNLGPNYKNGLKQIIWPGDSTTTPTGWAIPSLKIGVPMKLGFPEFVEQRKNGNKTTYTGFSVDVFSAVLETLDKDLGFKVLHDFIGFEDKTRLMDESYDDLLLQIKNKKFDAVVGDTTIVANMTDYVDFTLPYSESGWTMLVLAKGDNRKNMWIFLKPWTWDLWLTVGTSCIFITIVIRVMGHNTENTEFRGSYRRQLAMILLFPFYAFKCTIKGIKFIFVSTSLSSILTVDKLEPTFDNLERLRTKDHFIGFQRGCFVGNLLEKQFNFSRSQLKSYGTIQECHEALSNGSKNGGVTAIFDEIPYIRVFLKAYGSQYTTAGPIYRTVGFGFESSLVSYFSKAILLVRENETKMDEIEKRYFGEKVTSATLAPTISTGSSSLRAFNFGGLFIIAGIATLLAIAISERYIWQRPVALIRQYLTSDHPANRIELAAQPTAETDAGDHSPEVHPRVREFWKDFWAY
ncbi:glutamate receptor [Citrus sinensis]|uniref:Glutamate receptor n=1 Tax=Citrus sinensis TaxID=2711 RepID=A0ACB8P7N7_CITSI|nr:glutamate receptor [Citrus sinensis]